MQTSIFLATILFLSGVDGMPGMPTSPQILEKRGEQRRNWFRKQREFLLQDCKQYFGMQTLSSFESL